ncbi:MAG TPA: lytic polysaccharide monooxygenase, partial [Herpetosiphonaceae bacterium]|nr:lytic polysaccharide monooxygenase [Herpetosiphonaceae bacterium]
MHPRRRAVSLVTLGIIPLLAAVFVLARDVQAHGSLQTPISRVYSCFLEGPESPDTAACKAAVAAGGTQALYDWNEVNIADAAGRHRQIIPDGKLCSAGRDKYKAFDAARTDWPATVLPRNGGAYTFIYKATAPHRGTWEFYVTRDGYNPSQPLRWGDLEAAPFLQATNPPLSNGAYFINGQLPANKSGRHVIYSIWQRSDSPEAFYTCSEVIFGSDTAPTNTPATPTRTPPPTVQPTITRTPIAPTATTVVPPTPTTVVPPTATPSGQYPAWQPNTYYATGVRVSYGGRNYQ